VTNNPLSFTDPLGEGQNGEGQNRVVPVYRIPGPCVGCVGADGEDVLGELSNPGGTEAIYNDMVAGTPCTDASGTIVPCGSGQATQIWLPGSCVTTGSDNTGPCDAQGNWMSIAAFRSSALDTIWGAQTLLLNGNEWSASWGLIPSLPEQQLSPSAVTILSMVGGMVPSWLGASVNFSAATCSALNWSGGAAFAVGLVNLEDPVGIPLTAFGGATWVVGAFGGC
jgi:hypothetical protein